MKHQRTAKEITAAHQRQSRIDTAYRTAYQDALAAGAGEAPRDRQPQHTGDPVMDVDRLIAEVKQRRTVKTQIPGRSDSHEIIVESGTDVLAPPSPAGRGQVDATVYLSRAVEEPKKPAPPKRASQINVNHVPAPDSSFELGTTGMVLRETHITGYERTLSPLAGDYQLVLPDGTIESNSSAIVVKLFKELKRKALAGKK